MCDPVGIQGLHHKLVGHRMVHVAELFADGLDFPGCQIVGHLLELSHRQIQLLFDEGVIRCGHFMVCNVGAGRRIQADTVGSSKVRRRD